MPFRIISEDIKKRAVWLWEHGYARDDIVDILGVSQASLYRWKKNFEIHGSVLPPPPPVCGRPRIINSDMTHDLYTLVKEAPDMYLDEIQEWLLIAHNVGLSCTALDDNLWDLGIIYKLLHKAAAE